MLLVGLSVISATIGWVAAKSIRSPDEVARDTRPTVASIVSAPVEMRSLSSAIVVRGDAMFSASTEFTVDTDLGPAAQRGSGRPLITGRVPAVGSQLDEGGVAVEVSGRPVFILAGSLPMYRALGPGSVGTDVRQLETALARLGFPPGKVDTTYDKNTEQAVDRWYKAAGYPVVGPSDQDRDRLAAAEAGVSAAEDALAAAQSALTAASRGPSPSQIIAAEGAVSVARAALDAALLAREEAIAQAPPQDRDRVRREHDLLVLQAQNTFDVAVATLAELTAPPDTSAARSAVDRATTALAASRRAAADLRALVGTRIPRGELVFLPVLPRRVEQVKASLGAEPNGPVMVLSGADVEVVATIAATERQLVRIGTAVRIDEDSLNIHLNGVVSSIGETSTGEAAVHVRPDGPNPESLAGLNVRLSIPIESTSGEVLTVPVAAVWAASDGSSRVRVLRSDGTTTDITVRPGLSADGYVEVTPLAGGSLAAGDEVVLGLR